MIMCLTKQGTSGSLLSYIYKLSYERARKQLQTDSETKFQLKGRTISPSAKKLKFRQQKLRVMARTLDFQGNLSLYKSILKNGKINISLQNAYFRDARRGLETSQPFNLFIYKNKNNKIIIQITEFNTTYMMGVAGGVVYWSMIRSKSLILV